MTGTNDFGMATAQIMRLPAPLLCYWRANLPNKAYTMDNAWDSN